MTYPNNAGYKDTGVSKDNAELLDRLGITAKARREVAELFMGGFRGSTTEVADRLGKKITQVRPRCTELVQMDLLRRDSETTNQFKEYVLVWNG